MSEKLRVQRRQKKNSVWYVWREKIRGVIWTPHLCGLRARIALRIQLENTIWREVGEPRCIPFAFSHSTLDPSDSARSERALRRISDSRWQAGDQKTYFHNFPSASGACRPHAIRTQFNVSGEEKGSFYSLSKVIPRGVARCR